MNTQETKFVEIQLAKAVLSENGYSVDNLMKSIYFRLGTFGRWQKPVVQFSHSGQDWNKYFNIDELAYWIQHYTESGYNVIFKPLTK